MSVTTSSSAENSPEECETGERESDSAEFGACANWLNIILLKLAFIEIVFSRSFGFEGVCYIQETLW